MALALVLLLVFVVFLGVLGALSVVVAKGAASVSKSGGCLGGCGLALALVFLCGAGLLGLAAFLCAVFVGTAVEANPIRKIEIRRGTESARPLEESGSAPATDPAAPVHLLFTVEGDIGSELAELVSRVGDLDPARMEDFLTIHRSFTPGGEELAVYDFRLELRERDVAELEERIRRELHGLVQRLPTSVTIHFEGAERLY
jgi:hypothetical protein